jgi:hypothetical protein
MFNEKQRKIVLKIFKRMKAKIVLKEYKYFSYEHLIRYLKGNLTRTEKMDQKILTMLLDFQDDNFELLQEISKKNKKKI